MKVSHYEFDLTDEQAPDCYRFVLWNGTVVDVVTYDPHKARQFVADWAKQQGMTRPGKNANPQLIEKSVLMPVGALDFGSVTEHQDTR